MNRRSVLIGATLAALLFAGSALAGVEVPRTISFAPSAGGGTKAQEECQFQTKVPAAIQEFGGSDVQLVDKPSKGGRSLELSITEMHAPGGGPFSGPKWMTVSGKLLDHGKVIGSFRAKRLSTGGFVRGTCATLGRCAQAIGQDVATWLKAPTMDAELGDAR